MNFASDLTLWLRAVSEARPREVSTRHRDHYNKNPEKDPPCELASPIHSGRYGGAISDNRDVCRGRCRDLLHGSNETIAHTGDRLDISRILRGIAQRGAKLLDRGVQAVLKIHERVGGPQPLPHLFAGNHFTRFLEQDGQDAKGLARQADTHTMLAQFSRRQIYLEDSEAVHGTQRRWALFRHC